MAGKFFNKPQLSQTKLQQSEITNKSGVDNAANTKAAQVDKSIELLTGAIGSTIGIVGAYQENIEAASRLASGKEMNVYQTKIRNELSKIPNIEAFGRKEMDKKVKEINESFMEGYKDKPFRDQLSTDISRLTGDVIGQMITSRDNVYVQKVTDNTAEKASSLAQQYANKTLDYHEYKASVEILVDESMIAHQVPTSSELDLPDSAREKYRSLTRQQSIDAVLRGTMVQVGEPENSRISDFLDDSDFRKTMGKRDTDEEYNKLVAFAQKKGIQADKFKYTTDINSLKEGLYKSTNLGMAVDVDKSVKDFKALGNKLTAKDEHKLRKEFKDENSLVVSSDKYRKQLSTGVDSTVHMTPKKRDATQSRAFSDVLEQTTDGISVGGMLGALSKDTIQHNFFEYMRDGGAIPKDVRRLIDVPAGATSEKWSEANALIMSMEAASMNSGRSIEKTLGVVQVSKVRGLSRLLNDTRMDGATKKSALDAFHLNSTSFTSKGYLTGTPETKLDPEWLQDVSKDANWTTDDFVSSNQNGAEIEGNYQAFRLAGQDDSSAKDMALELFKESNKGFEMPDGGEIVLPVEHKYLNNESILAFSRDSSRFPSIANDRLDRESTTGLGWIADWRMDRNTSIRKSHDFAKSGKYDMLFNGRLVGDSSFTYSEMEDFISKQDAETRTKITGVKTNRPFSEVEEEALEQRERNIKRKDERFEHMLLLNDLSL